MASEPMVANPFPRWLLAGYGIVWAAMAIGVRDWPTWALENLPVILAIGILAATHRRFTF
jgi:uncharacterized membrane protein YjdF